MQTRALDRNGDELSSGTPVESVLFALMNIGRLLRQRTQGDGIDPGTFFLLKGIADNGPIRVTELAALANLDTSTISRHVQQLQRTGLIERTQDPADGRAQPVDLTDQGRQLLEQGLAARRELLGRSLNGWDPSDIAAFERLLARFVHGMEHKADQEKA